MYDDDFGFPFGKYRGQALSEIPSGYLRWLIREAICEDPDLHDAVQEELDSRQPGYRQNGSDHRGGADSMPMIEKTFILQIIDSGYRSVSKKVHPDVGGKHEQMVALNHAVEWLRKLVS